VTARIWYSLEAASLFVINRCKGGGFINCADSFPPFWSPEALPESSRDSSLRAALMVFSFLFQVILGRSYTDAARQIRCASSVNIRGENGALLLVQLEISFRVLLKRLNQMKDRFLSQLRVLLQFPKNQMKGSSCISSRHPGQTSELRVVYGFSQTSLATQLVPIN
jgi:hypothetical protein